MRFQKSETKLIYNFVYSRGVLDSPQAAYFGFFLYFFSPALFCFAFQAPAFIFPLTYSRWLSCIIIALHWLPAQSQVVSSILLSCSQINNLQTSLCAAHTYTHVEANYTVGLQRHPLWCTFYIVNKIRPTFWSESVYLKLLRGIFLGFPEVMALHFLVVH